MQTPEDLLLFKPYVPLRRHARSWDAERQRAFIAALARTGVVRAAAAEVGMSARSAYQLRHRAYMNARGIVDAPLPEWALKLLGPSGTFSFAAAWDLALRYGHTLHMESALPHAIEPERIPVVRRGQIVGWREKYNDRLAIAALGAWRREMHGPPLEYQSRMLQREDIFDGEIDSIERYGLPDWDSVASETAEEKAARKRRERALEKRYGKPLLGIYDPRGPADGPPRPLARQPRKDRVS